MNHTTTSIIENSALVAGTGACAAGTTAAAIGVATTVTIATAPAWAIPVAIAGGVTALGAGEWQLYKWLRK